MTHIFQSNPIQYVYFRQLVTCDLFRSSDEGCDCVEFPSCRLVLTMLAFFGFLNIYCLRVNLSVALVAMVNYSHPIKNISPDAVDNCGNPLAEKEKSATQQVSVILILPSRRG